MDTRYTTSALGRLIPNIEGLREKRRKLPAKLVPLHGALVWAPAVYGIPWRLGKITRIQQRAALQYIAAYRTVSYDAANLISGIPPIAGRRKTFNLQYMKKKELNNMEYPSIQK